MGRFCEAKFTTGLTHPELIFVIIVVYNLFIIFYLFISILVHDTTLSHTRVHAVLVHNTCYTRTRDYF